MADPTQRPADYARPPVRDGVGERLTGILGSIGRGVNEYLSDDEKPRQISFGAQLKCGQQPDALLSSAMGRQLETAQQMKLLSSQRQPYRRGNSPDRVGPSAEQYAQAIETNPMLAKEYFAAFIKEAWRA